MKRKPSVIFMGSKPGAYVALELLLKKEWEVHAVVPSGDHSFIAGPNIADLALAKGIPVMSQEDLQTVTADFVISYMFRHKVKSHLLAGAKRAALNFHAGPLPEYGGWAFYNIAILEEAKEYGCTCHHMDDGFDTGPLFKVRKFPIEANSETAISLERKTQREMIKLFVEFMSIAESDSKLPKIDQDKSKMRYLTKQEFDKLKEIPPDSDEETIQRIARAFFYPPYDCAFMKLGDNKIEVLPYLSKPMIAGSLHSNSIEDLRSAIND